MRYLSPLRYPGGKARLYPFVKSILTQNGLVDGSYAEPYAGGASLALALLLDEQVSDIYINDLDTAVYSFWRSVLDDTRDLCNLIRRTRVNPTTWKRQRKVYTRSGSVSLERGFAAFFLNRTNRSGIIESAGMIGGADQTGVWKIDARYNQQELAQRISRIARYRDRIHLTNLDAADFLIHVADKLPENTLVYLDPPYYVKGRRRLYANSYEPSDHAGISGLVRALPCHWIVSYDSVRQIRSLYPEFRRLTYSLQYTAATRQQGAEVMFFSPGLKIPATDRPTRAGARGVQHVARVWDPRRATA